MTCVIGDTSLSDLLLVKRLIVKHKNMNTKSIELLNNAMGGELSAMHQYLYFYFHCNEQGITKIAGLFKKAAIDEIQHAKKLADRILFLKGDINMGPIQPIQKIKSVKEMLRIARNMEDESAMEYN